MLRKNIKKIISILSAVIIAFSCFIINVSAADVEPTDDMTFQVPCATPSAESNSGYIELLLKNDSSGAYHVRVFSFSSFNNAVYSEASDNLTRITLYSSSVVFSNSLYYTSGNATFTFIYGVRSNYDVTYYAYISNGNSKTFSFDGYTIAGYHVYGSCWLTNSSAGSIADFWVLYADEAVQYNQLQEVISLINVLASDNDTIISQLNTIIANTDTIEAKLQSAIELLTTIETDLDTVNDYLKKLYYVSQDISSNTSVISNYLEQILDVLYDENLITPAPSDTTTTDEYSSKEQSVIDSTSSGREEVASLFNDAGSIISSADSIGRGMLAVTSIIKEFVGFDGLPWLSSIIRFSLILGIFGFVLGMSFLVIGRIGSSSKEKDKEVHHYHYHYFKGGKKK